MTLSANITNSAAATAFGDCLTLSIGGASPSDGVYTLYANYAYRISLSATVNYNSTTVPPNIETEIVMTGAPVSGTTTFTEEGQVVLHKGSTTYNEVIAANDSNPDIPSASGSGETYHLEEIDPIEGHDAILITANGNPDDGITEGDNNSGKVSLSMYIPENKAFIIQFTYDGTKSGQHFILNIVDDENVYLVDHQTLTLPAAGGVSYAVANGDVATIQSSMPSTDGYDTEKWFMTTGSGIGNSKMTFSITNESGGGNTKLLSSTQMILVFVDAGELF